MASRRIQGITIEIGGDTTKLNSALKDVDKKLAATQSELQDVNKLLKLDPKNTELLTQKQGLLRDAIKDSKSRLKDLQEAAAQLAEKDSSPEVEKQQRALQREIVATTQKIKGFEDELGKIPNAASQAFTNLGDTLQKAGGKITETGESLTKNVTLPIAAVGAAAVASFTEVDDAMDEVILKTGATGEAAAEMQKIVENVATTIPTDFRTAAEAVGQINTKFGATGDQLESLTTLFVKFASVNKKDVSSSVDSVQKSMSAYGLELKDTEHFLDLLTKTSQDTGADIDKLSDGIVQNAAAFQELGLSVDEAVALMGQMERSGANSETVMNGLRKALQKSTKAGIPLNQMLADLQDEIINNNDETAALAKTYDLFGKSGDQIFNAIRNGTLDFSKFGNTMKTVGGTVTKTFDATIDGADRWKMAMNEAKLLGSEIGGILSEFAGPVLQKVRDALKDAVEWWRGLSKEQQENILKITGIVAAIGPMVTIVGKATTAVGLLSKGLGVLAAHPVAAAILGIGTAIGGTIIAIDNHIKKVKAAAAEEAGWTKETETLVQAIEDQAQAYEDSLKAKEKAFSAMDAEYGHLQDLAEEYDSYLDKNGEVQKGYEDRAEFILTTLSESLGVERDEIDKIIKKNGELSSSIDQVIEKRKAEAVLNALESEYTEAIINAKDAEMNLANALAARSRQQKLLNGIDEKRKELEEQINELTDDQGRALNGLEGSVQPLREELGELNDQYDQAAAYLGVMDAAVEQAENTYEGYQTTIKNYEGVSAAIISGDTNKISRALEMYRNDFKTTETATAESLEAQFKKLDEEYKAMEEAVKSGSKDITAADLAEKRYWRTQALVEYSKATQDARDAAKAAAGGYAGEMAKGKKDVTDAVAKVTGGATTELDKATKYAADSGYNFTSGFAGGISGAADKAAKAAADAATRARNKMNQILGISSPSKVMMKTGEYFSEGFAIGINKAAKDAMTAAENMAGAAAGAAQPTTEARRTAANLTPAQGSDIVAALQSAMSGMKIILDDEVAGAFVERTVTRAVYAI